MLSVRITAWAECVYSALCLCAGHGINPTGHLPTFVWNTAAGFLCQEEGRDTEIEKSRSGRKMNFLV